MRNLFYELPHDIQNCIFQYAILKDIRERAYHLKETYDDYYIKTHGRKQPKWHVFIVNHYNYRKYCNDLYGMVDDYHYRINHYLFFLKWIKRNKLLELCNKNGLTVKKNSSKKDLIGKLIKV